MTKSTALFSRAQEVIPGGVNSPVRAFKGVGGTPVFIQKAKGAYIYDTEGKQYRLRGILGANDFRSQPPCHFRCCIKSC